MLMNAIPSFRLEKDVVEAEIDVLRALGVEFRCGVEVGKDVTIAQLREEGYKGLLCSRRIAARRQPWPCPAATRRA